MYRKIFVVLLAVITVGRAYSAPPPVALPPSTGPGMGKARAVALVSGITEDRTAMSELAPPKPLATSDFNPNPIPTQPTVLSSFEVIGGTDRLFLTPDVLRQASLFGEARYRLSQSVQFGASAAVRVQGNANATEAAVQLLVGPTFNIGGDASLRNAFFFTPKIGVTVSRTTANGVLLSSSVLRTISFVAGKRFSIGKNFAFAPSVGVIQEGSDTYLSVTPIGLSFFF